MDSNGIGMSAPDWKGGDVIFNRKLKKTANYWGNGGWLCGRLCIDGQLTDETGEWIRVMYFEGDKMCEGLWLVDDCEWRGPFMGLEEIK